MPRHVTLTDRQREALLHLPVDQGELLRHYTLSDDDLGYIRSAGVLTTVSGFRADVPRTRSCPNSGCVYAQIQAILDRNWHAGSRPTPDALRSTFLALRVDLFEFESREGFPGRRFCDSSWLLGREASSDGPSLFRRFARAILPGVGSRDVGPRCGKAA